MNFPVSISREIQFDATCKNMKQLHALIFFFHLFNFFIMFQIGVGLDLIGETLWLRKFFASENRRHCSVAI